MDKVFSMDSIASDFWSPSSPASTEGDGNGMMINRSTSGWDFQRFLQETSTAPSQSSTCAPPPPTQMEDHDHSRNQTIPRVDSPDGYQGYLKDQLNLACTTVALIRGASSTIPPDLAFAMPDNGSQEMMNDVVIQKKLDRQVHQLVKSADTSGSSREALDNDNDNDEVVGDTDIETKHARRRKLQNRESAIRSKKKKQAYLTELEPGTNVCQLRSHQSFLLKHLADITPRYNAAAALNTVLKADIETVRAKVMVSVERVALCSHMSTIISGASQNHSECSAPLIIAQLLQPLQRTSVGAAVPVQDGLNQQYVYNKKSSAP